MTGIVSFPDGRTTATLAEVIPIIVIVVNMVTNDAYGDGQITAHLNDTYCGSFGVETSHVAVRTACSDGAGVCWFTVVYVLCL